MRNQTLAVWAHGSLRPVPVEVARPGIFLPVRLHQTRTAIDLDVRARPLQSPGCYNSKISGGRQRSVVNQRPSPGPLCGAGSTATKQWTPVFTS